PIPDPAPPLEEAVTEAARADGPHALERLQVPIRRADVDSHSGVPWLKLLTNVNLWTLCLIYFCASYGWYFNITWLPKYLRSHYHVSAETDGVWTMSFLSGAPLLFGALACLVGGLLTDGFIRRTGNLKWGRRLFG